MFGSLMRLEHEVWVEEVRAAAGHSVRPPDGLRMGRPQKSRTSAAQVWAASADHHGAQTWAPWWSAEGFIKATSVCCDRLNCTYRGLFSFKGARSHPDPACYRGDAKDPPPKQQQGHSTGKDSELYKLWPLVLHQENRRKQNDGLGSYLRLLLEKFAGEFPFFAVYWGEGGGGG